MPRTKANWIAIRTAYVVKGYSAQKCATEFSVDVTTIKKRASSEGWTAERHRNTTQGGKVAEDAARDAVAKANAERQQSDRAFTDSLQALVENGKKKLEKIKDPGDYIMAASRLVAAGQRVVLTRRIVTGTVPGQPSDFVAADDADDEIDNEIKITQRRLEPLRIAVDNNGREIKSESA
ncbi:MAG: hypothetical protein JWO85_562 [Candidatus Eremiobacteraeota bacterium]|nr:hypothetical protein [Candidatus Eremiobacteraeota bacterium]